MLRRVRARWLPIGVPLVAIFLPITRWLPTVALYPVRPAGAERGALHAREERTRIGRIRRAEWTVVIVFTTTAFCWIVRPLLVEIEVADHRPHGA